MEDTLLGCRISYDFRRGDDASAPTVLLLHGWGCDGSIFSFIQSGLPKSASVLTVDFPGFGHSDEPPEPWGVPEYTEQIYILLKSLDIISVFIVAHSFGGRVAICLSAAHPELVKKLVLTGGAGIRKPITQSQQKRQSRYKRYNAALNAIKGIKPLSGAVDKWQQALRNKYGSEDYVKLNENMRKTFVKVISLDLLDRLKDIAAPTLLIWGERDADTPLWMGREMEARIPDAGLVVFEGGTHFAFIEQWQRFLLIVRQFFWGGGEA